MIVQGHVKHERLLQTFATGALMDFEHIRFVAVNFMLPKDRGKGAQTKT